MSENIHPYIMTVDLNVIRHLGIGLYNSNPVVIAEAVANSYDADAHNVRISISPDRKTITIDDDGHGMTREQVNSRFLHIGYERRKEQGERSESGERLAMGRKGIGKLSLFAIADDIAVYTKRDGQQVEAFRLNAEEIQKQITDTNKIYHPEPITAVWDSDKPHGTRIVLTKLKRDPGSSSQFLRERLARRFSVIGEANNFAVHVNDNKISVADRGYLKFLEYIWTIGGWSNDTPLENDAKKVISLASDKLTGWIGTVKKPSQLKEQGSPAGQSANGIVVMVRGRVAHENILDSIGEAGLYAQYVVGELHADFLDPSDGSMEDDLITSSRQLLREDDVNVKELREHIRSKLKEIERDWTEFRNADGVEQALLLPSIDEWFGSLDKDAKAQATKLFGKINSIRFKDDDDNERADLFRYGVIAFEKMRAQKNLSELEHVSVRDVEGFLKAFKAVDEVEAALYHETVRGRLEIIRHYLDLVNQGALEKVLQRKLFDHLWLLDASWDRATGTTEMEVSVSKFLKTDRGICSKEIERSRMDIVYREFSGTHVVIEMKRRDANPDVYELLRQIDKYRQGLVAHLRSSHQVPNPFVQTIILLDKEPKAWSDSDEKARQLGLIEKSDARVLTYRSLLNKARSVYEQFLQHDSNVARISKLLERIQKEIADQKTAIAAE